MDARRKLRRAGVAIKFANRLAAMREKRDRAVVDAVGAERLHHYLGDDTVAPPPTVHTGLPPRGGAGAGSGRPPTGFKSPTAALRLVQEERSAKMEDAGIFERRFGLKQRSRAHMLHRGASRGRSKLATAGSGNSLTEELVSPTSSDPTEYHHTTPLPPRRTLGGAKAMAHLRSPLASERKLADVDDSDTESTRSGVSDDARRVAPWDRRRGSGGSSGGGIRLSGQRASEPSAAVSSAAAKAKARRVMKAVMFANRLSDQATFHDRRTEDAARRAGTTTATSRPPHLASSFDRLKHEERAADVEAAGVFESRLHLREQMHGGHAAPSRAAGRRSSSPLLPGGGAARRSASPLMADGGKAAGKLGKSLLASIHRS